ncbi:MAG: hypothetical protein HQK84_07595 [Nitrospinae bacterium]|nr:hypothetical protein [Nitrospinota bacterium]
MKTQSFLKHFLFLFITLIFLPAFSHAEWHQAFSVGDPSAGGIIGATDASKGCLCITVSAKDGKTSKFRSKTVVGAIRGEVTIQPGHKRCFKYIGVYDVEVADGAYAWYKSTLGKGDTCYCNELKMC